jgi:release factor glutamine methyltransferase
MTIEECSKYLKLELEKSKIDDSQLEAELIIEHFLNVDKKYLILNKEEEIDKNKEEKIKKGLKKRKKGRPLAYIKREKYFYKSKFIVNENVLIPRPESEIIIDEIIKEDPEEKTIIDVGTGSACLIISVCKEVSKNNDFYGLDISKKALKTAKLNAELNEVDKEIKFIKSNLLKKIKKENLKKDIIIIANLPYLTRKEIKESKTIQTEPYKALYGGKDGLKYYRKLLKQVKRIKDKKNHIEIYMEISDWQKDYLILVIEKIFKNKSYSTETIKDFLGQNRLIKLTI